MRFALRVPNSVSPADPKLHFPLARPRHVAIGDIEQTALDAAVPELRVAAGAGLAVEGFRCDVTDPSSCDDFAAAVHSAASFAGAPVAVLHANAGVGAGPSILDSTPGDWEFTFRVNVFGVV